MRNRYHFRFAGIHGVRRTTFARLPVLAVLATALLLFACDSRNGESDAEADRNQLIVLSSLITGAIDFELACNRSVAAGFACAEETGLGTTLARESYAGLLQVTLGMNSKPASDSAATLCPAIFDSSLLARASGTTRVCWFQCEANFWNTALATTPTTCGPAEYGNLAARAPGEILSCFNTCVSATSRFYY